MPSTVEVTVRLRMEEDFRDDDFTWLESSIERQLEDIGVINAQVVDVEEVH